MGKKKGEGGERAGKGTEKENEQKLKGFTHS